MARKLTILTILVELITVSCTNDPPKRILCNGLIFHGVYYDREEIIGHLGKPYNLVIHNTYGTLFFSHTIVDNKHVDFGIMKCEMETKMCSGVTGIPGGYAIALDPQNDEIYFGGHDGIYKYDVLSSTAAFFAEKGKSIWGLFIKKSMYYIDYPKQKLYVFAHDKFVPVAEAMDFEIDNFFISRHGIIYFSNKTALYKIERRVKKPMELNREIMVRQIAEDKYGDVYFCASNGIYIEEKPYNRVKLVSHIHQAFGLAFDEYDRVIYSDMIGVYRLNVSNNSHICHGLAAAQNRDKNYYYK